MLKNKIKKVLIANRGEIACRIIRTCKKLNIVTVAIYSDADANAMHVSLADEAYRIGPAPSQESYLKSDEIIKIAQQSDAQAIHPGYGFLSENADFATACINSGLLFIGPPAAAIRAMGSKSHAKALMEKAQVPLIPGYHDDAQDEATLTNAANKMGYPILIKATAGGGGKGMRVVKSQTEFLESLQSAKREAFASFGDDEVLLEKYLEHPRHIEIQVFADHHNNIVHLFERDCSIQRRHQKIIEEAPAPGLSDTLRNQMGEMAIRAARAIQYVGAGTIEFLLDQDQSFYFMEMNTRLQVEHPVTEMITQQDLVEWQLRVTAGEPLPLKQNELKIHGHAFETRLYAEDPEQEFLPSCGFIELLETPKETTQVRIDTGIRAGDTISPYYDPMIAKLIVWGNDRKKALSRLQQSLAQYHIIGIRTNIDLLMSIAEHKDFINEKISTHFIAQHHDELFNQMHRVPFDVLALASLYQLLNRQKNNDRRVTHSNDPYSPWNAQDSWQIAGRRPDSICFNMNHEIIVVNTICLSNTIYKFYDSILPQSSDHTLILRGNLLTSNKMRVEWLNDNNTPLPYESHEVTVLEKTDELNIIFNKHYRLKMVNPLSSHEHSSEINSHLTAPMPGKVVALNTAVGNTVEPGASLLIMEAMKMEHTIRAPAKGIVKQFHYQVGDRVEEGAELLEFEVLE